ncbi:hypothetical protein AB0368_06850 [Actinoplanes sp. NPDC051475]|uniref:hypothetical protein n=1 Tax=Actinoplanes sp. NPDC051475 TaxID=3157225 RepID=UPI00344B5F0A
MERDEVLTRMHNAAALWSVGHVTAAELVDVACDLLIAGFDGLNLAMLAGVHVRHADEEVPELLEAALTDAGLSYHPRGSHAGQEAAVRVMASRVVTGLMPALDLVAWAHSTIGHDRVALAERLVELDDVYDTLEYTDMTEQDVNDQILAEARRIVGTSGASARLA